MYKLSKRLEEDTTYVNQMELSEVRILKDSQCPWIVLIPRVENIKEVFELSENDQQELMREISTVSKLVQDEFQCDKINVGALGNMVPQLHIHIIGRYKNDRAWPHALWGSSDQGLSEDRDILSERLRAILINF